MNRKPYSAGAVKFSFWFIEFRKTVRLLAEGKSFSEIKLLNEQENCREDLCNTENGRMIVELYLGKQEHHVSRILY